MHVRTRRHVAISIPLLAAAAMGAAVAGAEDVGTLVQVGAQANRESAASQRLIDHISDTTDRLFTEYRSILKQIDSLRVYNAQLEKLITSQEAEKTSLQEQIDRVVLVGRGVTPLMMEMIDSLEEFVSLDVPFLVEERTRRVAELREILDRSDVTDAEKYRRILEAYQIENEYGRTIEAYEGTLDRGGQKRTVDFLRVGRIALLYRTRDGNEIGAWSGENGSGDWIELPASYRTPIREGLRIARKQAAPDLITLPIPAPEDAL